MNDKTGDRPGGGGVGSPRRIARGDEPAHDHWASELDANGEVGPYDLSRLRDASDPNSAHDPNSASDPNSARDPNDGSTS